MQLTVDLPASPSPILFSYEFLNLLFDDFLRSGLNFLPLDLGQKFASVNAFACNVLFGSLDDLARFKRSGFCLIGGRMSSMCVHLVFMRPALGCLRMPLPVGDGRRSNDYIRDWVV